MSEVFRFKEFEIAQDRCAMKVGTDGVLLGAWASVDHQPETVLDIGAGTGLIALMLAQRCHAHSIDGIELDDDAYEQCVENFERSPWGDRLFCYHAALVEFIEEMEDSYDLIVSNPPFYSEDHKSGDEQRDLARFQDAMPFEHLVVAAARFLSDTGRFAVVLPAKEMEAFINLAERVQLFPTRILKVQGRENTPVVRCLLEFSRTASTSTTKTLIIENSRHNYTEDYIALTKDFYLKM